jgi:catechol 2,3-dioxygenase
VSNESSDTAAAATGATLPDDLSLGAVHLRVTDLDRSVGFYERAIGLTTRERGAGIASLGAGGEDLLVLHERPGARRAGSHAGLYHFALLHPTRADLGRAVLRLEDADVPIQGASDHGISEAIYLPDPDGNGIELAADRPPERWGDLRDPTTIGPAPLDMASLLVPVSGEEATERARADRDLRVGHLHMHVGDVEEALRFWRDVVGFEVMTDFDSAAFVAAGGYHHHLGLNVWRGQGVPPPPDDALGLEHWTILLDPASLDSLRERLRAASVGFDEIDEGIEVLDPWNARTRLLARA